jgi:hypothetical protein
VSFPTSKRRKWNKEIRIIQAFAFVLSLSLSCVELNDAAAAADEAAEMTRRGTDGLKVSKQQPPRPPVMTAKGTPPLKQIPGYTPLAAREVLL